MKYTDFITIPNGDLPEPQLFRNNHITGIFYPAFQFSMHWMPNSGAVQDFDGYCQHNMTEPKQYSYYILNTYAAGISWPFQWKGVIIAWFSIINIFPMLNPVQIFCGHSIFIRDFSITDSNFWEIFHFGQKTKIMVIYIPGI